MDWIHETRKNYHLTYGELIDALKGAGKDESFDNRVKGVGSFRGYYTDIALFREEKGADVDIKEDTFLEDTMFDFTPNVDYEKYTEWSEENTTEYKSIPKNANELGIFLESLLGGYFTGYKGGSFLITREKPLWLASCSRGDGENLAVIGIDKKLKLITKKIE